MPVLREERILGVITLVHHTPGYFTGEHLDLLRSVAAQSAVALESAQLYSLTRRQKELIERRAEELQRINEISQYMAELMRPEQLLRLVAHMVHHTFGYPQVSILVREGDELVVQASAGSLVPQAPRPLRMPAASGINGWVLRHNRPLRIDDVRHDERFFDPEPGLVQVRAELAVPIILHHEVLGTLDVQSVEAAAFGPNDEALLATIGTQLGVALGNARMLANEERRIRQLGQVNRLSLAITARLDAAQNLQVAADAVARIFEVRHAGVLVLDSALPLGKQGDGGPLIALHGPPGDADADLARLIRSYSQASKLLQELQEPLIVSDLQTDEQLASLHRFFSARGICTLVLVPLIARSRVIGLLAIDASSGDDRFGSADLELARNVASLIAQVIENARLYRVVEDERSRLTAVLRGAADPILLIGPHNELLLANRAAQERLGIDLATGAGKPLPALLKEGELLALLANNMDEGDIQIFASGAAEVTLPSGTTYSVSIAPVPSADGEAPGRVAVLQDITAIKLLERQEQERLRTVFRRYVSPDVAERLLSAGQEFGQPTERTVVVLFADIRGFTALTERVGPRVLVEHILNRYFTAMTEVLLDHEGTIDKFMGDGVIGVFGSPISRPDDPLRALTASVQMQRAFANLRADWQQELGLDVGIGIGLSYGQAVVGNIGSEQRVDYTLIGDVVNTASRLSNLAKPGQVIVSHHLINALPPEWRAPWHLRPLGDVQLKGKQDPHAIFEIRYEPRQEEE
jgi:adenylate cyclase